MMKSVRKPSVIPVYAVAAVWVLYTAVFGLSSSAQLLLCAAISIGVYLLLKTVFPGETVQVEVPEKAPDTGDKELDAAIVQGRESIRKIQTLNAKIPDPGVSNTLCDIEDAAKKIFRRLEEDRTRLKQCRRFLDYYLPTTIHLLEQYVRFQEQGRHGDIDEAMGRIERVLSDIRTAFRRQLDSLFEQDVVDVNADITVMEQMLRAQGLTDENEGGTIHG